MPEKKIKVMTGLNITDEIDDHLNIGHGILNQDPSNPEFQEWQEKYWRLKQKPFAPIEGEGGVLEMLKNILKDMDDKAMEQTEELDIWTLAFYDAEEIINSYWKQLKGNKESSNE